MRFALLILLFISFTNLAQEEKEVANDPPVFSVEAASQTLQETVLDIWYDFIAHTPYIIVALIILLITGLASTLVSKLIGNMTGRSKMRGSLRELTQRIVRIIVWILGILLAAMVIFPGLTPAKAIGGLGLASVAIGFAFKEIFENFFAGILLLWKYPFEKGDFIECEDILGRVENISVRMTELRRPDGELVVLPNSFLFKNPVFVLTHEDSRRMQLMTGVAYSEDARAALPIIKEAVEQCDLIVKDKGVEVFLNAFGSSSIDIEVTWWADPTPLGERKSRSEVVGAIKQALDDAGIEIPFPYRTLTFNEPIPVRYEDVKE
ncbi:mechanosensitive ion channel family protein [Aliiglaciecola lipolytica]|uniref:Small-conductance mechanosensitive channel n=1 Tax=Aliiglaciecola lipolytica E3 TaxID=1127673 RepID=K6Y5H4_9ALTE|nr:mechanosensitive ion channel family protein [Aliiglaciecola lipolytica]GAC13492.1 MscS mechanosensitive ion channel [Aliiglaciecola lipolytica E3]